MDLNFILKILIGLLIVVTFFQVIRLIELSSRLAENRDQVTDKSNFYNGLLLLLSGFGLLAFFFWQRAEWGHLTLQAPASEHGVLIDQLWDTTMGLIIVVFLVLQPILFGFSYFYRGRKNRKAYFISHNNKLEIFWTAIPTVVLSVLIVYGLVVWGDVTDVNNAKGGIQMEVYAKQFGWTIRYAGDDNKLGDGHVRFYAPTNPLGVVTDNMYELQSEELESKIKSDKEKLLIEKNISKKKSISDRIERNIAKNQMYKAYYNSISDEEKLAGEDDIVVSELFLPVNKKVAMKFRSQDVIHSAYMPHFRAQMNCVPGLSTQFVFTPTMTSEEYKEYLGNPDFDYVLLCNKICGNAHYNMKMKIVVVTQEEYDIWLKEQAETRMIKNM